MNKRFGFALGWVLCLAGGRVVGQTAFERGVVEMDIDPRIELLAVVQSLTDYDDRYRLLTDFDFPYKHDVAAHFSKYKDHEAVTLFAEMSAEGFCFDAPPAAMLYLSAPPELAITVPLTEYLNRRAGGAERLERFVRLLRDFAQKTEFMAFYAAHEPAFLDIAATARSLATGCDYAGDLESYYGMHHSHYRIVLGLLFHPGGFGPRVEDPDGTIDVYQICGPAGVLGDSPTFGTPESLRSLVWHEFGHSFVNPATEKFADRIAACASLYEPIGGRMKSQAYGNWQTCVNEHLVRAVTTRLTHIQRGKDAADRAAWEEKQRGFMYIDALCDALQEYESQRQTYPSFEAFYPRLVEVFEKLAEEDLPEEFYRLPFKGTINAVSADTKGIVLVAPTNETDRDAQDEIHQYVLDCRDMFFEGCPVYSDVDALRRDLSDRSVLAYGTLEGNLWLAKHLSGLPIEITPTHIVAEKEYSGTDLRLITAWPHPEDSQRGIIVYTAQKAADIPKIHRVFHGPTDYVIARGTKALTAADYTKHTSPWTLNREPKEQD